MHVIGRTGVDAYGCDGGDVLVSGVWPGRRRSLQTRAHPKSGSAFAAAC